MFVGLGFIGAAQVGYESGSIWGLAQCDNRPKLVLSYLLNWVKVVRIGLGKE